MDILDRRSAPRKKTLIHAFASDLAEKYDVKCVIRDVSRTGCRIVSSHIDDLPEIIKITPVGFDKPVFGKIVWKESKEAGVQFLNGERDLNITHAQQSEAPLDFFSKLQKFSVYSRRSSALQGTTDRNWEGLPKGDIAARMLHKMRAPLSVVMGALGFLRAGALGDLPARIKTMVGIAHGNAGQMMALANDMMDMRNIESGAMTFDFEATDIAGLASEAIEANAPKGANFRLDNQVGDVIVEVDPQRIGQVLDNLIMNAAKFSEQGQGVVVALTRIGKSIRVAVIDSGPGIPADMHQKIFEKFVSLDRTEGETGLGLSICKAIIEAHGSSIHVVSEAGHGATFYFDLTEFTMAANSPDVEV